MEKQERLFYKTIYCMDSNSLINITRYPGYQRDIFLSIWDKLENMVNEEKIILHVEVFRELKRKEDKILEWCKQNKNMFKEINERQQAVRELPKMNPCYCDNI